MTERHFPPALVDPRNTGLRPELRAYEEFVPHCSEIAGARCKGEQRPAARFMWQELLRNGMTPGEIRACYRLYAAHRLSHEICTFPKTIPVINDAGDPGDLAVLLRLHTGLGGLAREIGQGAPNDDLYPAAGHVGHLRKLLTSFAAQLFSRRYPVGH